MHRYRSFLLQSVYVVFSLVISSCRARWYSQICPAGPIESIRRDNNGHFVFVLEPDEEHGDDGYSESSSGSSNNITSSDEGNLFEYGNNRRNLRQSTSSFESSVSAIKITKERYTAEAQAEDIFNHIDNNNNDTIFYFRPCLCHPTQRSQQLQSDAVDLDRDHGYDIWLCPPESDYCGIPFSSELEETVGCYSVNVQQVVARNAWPLILLWYFGLVIICCCTIHGHTAKEYLRSCYNPNHNVEFMDRMLAGMPSPPTNQWVCSWFAWQRYRFELNLNAQVQWVWRHEARQQWRREQGLHPPQLEMKTKRYVMEETGQQKQQDQTNDVEDHDSLNEPTCTICFVPLEEGDRIGALECDHNFHVDCLKSWLIRRNACPLCQQAIAKRRQPEQETTTENNSRERRQPEQSVIENNPRERTPTEHENSPRERRPSRSLSSEALWLALSNQRQAEGEEENSSHSSNSSGIGRI